MDNYKIKGGDGNEYGPVNANELREWVSQGRANGQTKVKVNAAGDWLSLSRVPEFNDLFGAVKPPPSSASATELGGARADNSMDPSAGLSSFSSQGYGGDHAVSAILEPLAKASGWMKLSAIVMFVSAAMQIIGTLGIGLIFAWLPIWMGVLVWKAANRANDALMDGSQGSAIAATKALKTYFILVGVLSLIMIIMMVFYVILIFGLGASGMLEGLQQPTG